MDAERASRHRIDTIETESRGRCVLVSVQIQHVPCEACYTARARACEESFFAMTSKHVVYKLVFLGESIPACTSTVQCSAREFATSIVLLLMTKELSAALECSRTATSDVAHPSQHSV